MASKHGIVQMNMPVYYDGEQLRVRPQALLTETELTYIDRSFCEFGQRIARRDGLTVVKADGDCTALYWHLHDCDLCRDLADEAA